jgi:DNA-binding IclR family transcriptional regulator
VSADGSINRTLRVLVALCEHGPQSLAELSERVGLSPPTTLRFLRLMRDEGFASQDANRQWRPTLLTWRLGCAVVDGDGWRDAVNDALRIATETIGETTVYAAYEDGWAVYVAIAEPRRALRTHVALGSRYHAADTVTGQCMLAFRPESEVEEVMAEHWGGRWKGAARTGFLDALETIRADRSAAGSGAGLWSGLWGAAIPIFGRGGEVHGSIGTVLPAGRLPADPTSVVDALRAAARNLTG